jgi:hypothetical protein
MGRLAREATSWLVEPDEEVTSSQELSELERSWWSGSKVGTELAASWRGRRVEPRAWSLEWLRFGINGGTSRPPLPWPKPLSRRLPRGPSS